MTVLQTKFLLSISFLSHQPDQHLLHGTQLLQACPSPPQLNSPITSEASANRRCIRSNASRHGGSKTNDALITLVTVRRLLARRLVFVLGAVNRCVPPRHGVGWTRLARSAEAFGLRGAGVRVIRGGGRRDGGGVGGGGGGDGEAQQTFS
ncbi:hypothetical protein IWX49DRAFT_373482 [Phyllosticta citricarpa]|uniref:Uncharacterized protein n=1 Tax=Phyllosticta paracitricarpa TaxID=2016321 RepID=A0ABR1NBP2_9PEZI